MKNFIDFVADCAKDKELEKEFRNVVVTSNQLELTNWFNKKGYELTEEDINKVNNNKNEINYQKVGWPY